MSLTDGQPDKMKENESINGSVSFSNPSGKTVVHGIDFLPVDLTTFYHKEEIIFGPRGGKKTQFQVSQFGTCTTSLAKR